MKAETLGRAGRKEEEGSLRRLWREDTGHLFDESLDENEGGGIRRIPRFLSGWMVA